MLFWTNCLDQYEYNYRGFSWSYNSPNYPVAFGNSSWIYPGQWAEEATKFSGCSKPTFGQSLECKGINHFAKFALTNFNLPPGTKKHFTRQWLDFFLGLTYNIIWEEDMKKKKEEEEYEEEKKERKKMNTLRFSMISGGFKLRVVEQVMWPCSVLVHCIQVYANFRTKVACLHFTQSQNIPSWPMQSTTLTGVGAIANFSNAHVFHSAIREGSRRQGETMHHPVYTELALFPAISQLVDLSQSATPPVSCNSTF